MAVRPVKKPLRHRRRYAGIHVKQQLRERQQRRKPVNVRHWEVHGYSLDNSEKSGGIQINSHSR
jgi:hypothetical protein